MGLLLIVKTVNNNILECFDNAGKSYSFEVKRPWLQFLKHLNPFDQAYIQHVDDIIDDNGLLVIDPHYLIAVTRAIDSISCPRKNYVKTMGAEEIADKFQFKRIIQGNLIHNVFSKKLATGISIENAIKIVMAESELILLTSDMSAEEALIYLNKDAIVMRGLSIQGETEIDCQNWRFGLHGKFDGIGSTQIIELKTSKIPDIHPWPMHNLQMLTYLKMMENRGDYKGIVLYVRDGQMGMKYPTKWDYIKTAVARNYTYLIISGKITPPVIRGENVKECRNCFVKEGCASLCAGLETQRDCEHCYNHSICGKNSWSINQQNYFFRLSDALIHEENEQNKGQYLYSAAGMLSKSDREMLVNRGFATKTIKKIFQNVQNGIFISKFLQISKMSRFRRGDLARAYDISKSHKSVTLFHSVIITDFSRDTISLESTNELPEKLCVVPSSSSSHFRGGRRAIYRTTQSSSYLITLIQQSLGNGNLNLAAISKEEKLLHLPLKEYNRTQLIGLQLSLNTPELLLIQGPAGTGKTSVIVELINQLHRTGKSVLCSAFTNMAVDNIGIKLKEHGVPFIRLGRLHSMDPDLHDYSATAKPEIFKSVVEKKTVAVVLSTTSTIAQQNYENFWFDYVLLDEAAQMTEPDALKALLLGEKAIMVGDHAQLQPIILSKLAQNLDLQVSLFERLVKLLPSRFTRLAKQYRMNDEILKFPNKMFYENSLKPANEVIAHHRLVDFAGKLVDSKPYEVVAIRDDNHNPAQQINHTESILIISILYELFKFNPELKLEDIGIITPFRAQVAHLRTLLPGFDIDTVDRFQGTEREIIVYSTITVQEIPILTDPRRMNVALTRARKKLIVLLTNPIITKNQSLLDELYNDALGRGITRKINNAKVLELKEFNHFNRYRQSLLQRVNIQFSPLEPELYADFDDKFDKSIGKHVQIFFKSIQLTVNSIEGEESCIICRQKIKLGVQCLGCAYWYHEDHLKLWLENNVSCPICKNTLNLI